MSYVGRFAPSPTGPLHAGSLVAALASWLDAKAHGGSWLLRIEDVDRPRCQPGADEFIMQQLACCGLMAEQPPLWQCRRNDAYAQALARLKQSGWVYGCVCSRKDIALALAAAGSSTDRHVDKVYPGSCRNGLRPADECRIPAWRLISGAERSGSQALTVHWQDRRLGSQQQDLTREVGDFVLQRADGLWSYQLAVVVDDAAQGVTDIVRGADLADNTPRQIRLQQLLGLPQPRYLHLPLVLGADGEKLSKQNGAAALELSNPATALRAAAQHLGLSLHARQVSDVLAEAVSAWRARWRSRRSDGSPC